LKENAAKTLRERVVGKVLVQIGHTDVEAALLFEDGSEFTIWTEVKLSISLPPDRVIVKDCRQTAEWLMLMFETGTISISRVIKSEHPEAYFFVDGTDGTKMVDNGG